MNINFRRMTLLDIDIFKSWIVKEHVKRWYTYDSWVEEITQMNGKYKDIVHYIFEVDNIPVGFFQYYEYERYGEDWHGYIPLSGTYSIDYLIGEESFLRKRLSKSIISFMIEEIRKIPGSKRIIAQPEKDNEPSRKALRNASFTYLEDIDVFIYYL